MISGMADVPEVSIKFYCSIWGDSKGLELREENYL